MGNANDTREWDARSIDGTELPDGIPDNFFPITNPNQLGTSLTHVFRVISARISSGTAAAVVANSSTGLGAVYQAYYHPSYTDPNGHRFPGVGFCTPCLLMSPVGSVKIMASLADWIARIQIM
jgi:hypothetical protein